MARGTRGLLRTLNLSHELFELSKARHHIDEMVHSIERTRTCAGSVGHECCAAGRDLVSPPNGMVGGRAESQNQADEWIKSGNNGRDCERDATRQGPGSERLHAEGIDVPVGNGATILRSRTGSDVGAAPVSDGGFDVGSGYCAHCVKSNWKWDRVVGYLRCLWSNGSGLLAPSCVVPARSFVTQQCDKIAWPPNSVHVCC